MAARRLLLDLRVEGQPDAGGRVLDALAGASLLVDAHAVGDEELLRGTGSGGRCASSDCPRTQTRGGRCKTEGSWRAAPPRRARLVLEDPVDEVGVLLAEVRQRSLAGVALCVVLSSLLWREK